MRYEYHHSRHKMEKEKKDMKSQNLCTHCNMSGNWIEKCWKLQPQFCPKKDKKVVQKTVQKEAVKEVMDHVINVPALVSEET
jgi:hypothetical protein